MVFSESARRDIDNTMLNGDTVMLYKQNNPTEDLSYGTISNNYTTFSLKAQGTISNFGDSLVRQGMISVGDARIILRFQYTEESDGTAIAPTLYPKKEDEISLGGFWFKLDTVTPVMSEDAKIICYECTAKPASTEQELVFPLTFPIILTE